MKYFLSFILLFAYLARAGFAQDTSTQPINAFVLRTAEQLQPPHIVTYRVAEWEQFRGRWIPFDIGYYDSGYGKDQLWLAGAGLVPALGPRFRWEQEVYLIQESGVLSQGRRSLWLWPVINLELRPRLTAQIVPYPTIPLDRAQRRSFDFDRAKLEWSFNSHWRAGPGYSGGLCGGAAWHSQPFLTVTRSTRAGSFEFWLQSISGGAQVQLRYVLVRGEH